MSWFDDTFLPSLFERFGRETHWLTRKQTAICTRYMERHTVMVDQFQGDWTRHHYYTKEWRGRIVTLNYSKLNGCGTISFGSTEQERADLAKRQEVERTERELRSLRRLRERRPDRFLKQLEDARNAVKYWEEEIEEDQADPEMQKYLPRDRELLAEALEKVKIMEAML